MARNKGFLASPLFTYIQAYFLTIASVLGSGILGLPVTLENSGILPFLTSFAVSFIVQVILIYFFVDLLQKTSHRLAQKKQDRAVAPGKDISLQSLGSKALSREGSSSSNEDEDENNPFKPAGGVSPSKLLGSSGDDEDLQPNLHSMAQLFLGPWGKYGFDIIVMMLFVAFLIGYALAGSQAFQQLFHLKSLPLVIVVFVWCNVAAIVFLQALVKPVVSVMTLAKGGILVVTVIVAFVVGSRIESHTTTDFDASGEPFLMGIVALGGIVNMMPLMYTRVNCRSAKQVTNFRRAVTLGMLTCAILNVLWCYAVLSIVPQHCSLCVAEDARPLWMSANTTRECCNLPKGKIPPDECIFCLQQSNTHGRISTVPLINVVEAHYPGLTWMAVLIELFIIISITVSFLVYGSSLKHLWDGFLADVLSRKDKEQQRSTCCVWSVRYIAYAVSFGGIFLLALANPEGFVKILDRGVSLLLNLEIAFFIVPMVRASWESSFRSLPLVVSLPGWFYWLIIPVFLYTLIAVTYDISSVAADHMFR